MSSPPPPHPALEPLAFLLGTWRGEGRGLWVDPPFGYTEEVVIDHAGKPFLRYAQRTWAVDDGRALHSEAGYIRPAPGGVVELVLVQPTGIVEVHAGRLEGRTLALELVTLARAPSAKPVTAVSRRIWVEDGALRYLVRMGMNDEPPADHLSATLLGDAGTR